jgi:hypothetical protein
MIVPPLNYRTHSAFPIAGGSAVIPGETVINTGLAGGFPFMSGVTPPPDVTPLDQTTHDFLVQAYAYATGAPNFPGIKPVGT